MAPANPRAQRRRRGRPPLGPERLEARVGAYCARYGVAVGAGGLPPFPSGRRETRQHREWLTIYKAVQRLAKRHADAGGGGSTRPPAARADVGAAPGTADVCGLCGKPLRPPDALRFAAARSRLSVHPACSELLRLALDAGPEAVRRLASVLWPR
jgi:hypothetical protein